MWKTFFMVLLLFSHSSAVSNNKTNLIETINGFINFQKIPTKVTGVICWKKEWIVKFWKKLSKNYHTNVINPASSLRYSQPEEQQLILVDMACNGSQKILEEAGKYKLFKAPFRWLFWGETSKTNLSDYYFGVDSRVFVIENNGFNFDIKSIYKYSNRTTDLIENYITSWSDNQGFSHLNDFSAPRNRSNIMGARVGVSYVITDPDSFNHVWDYRNKHLDAVSKMNYVLVHHLITMLNGSIEHVFRNTWGYKNTTTNQFSGMFGDLQRGETDLGGTPSFFSEGRIEIVDFVAATTYTYMKFIFRAPPLSQVTNVFTLPFNSYVWYSCFLTIAIIFVVVYGIVMWEWRDPVFQEKISTKYKVLRPKVFDVFMMEIEAISQQGSNAEPYSNAGRIATIFTFIALMFLYTAYSANIVALLQSTTESIRTVNDLLTSRIKLGVEDVVYARFYFKVEKEPIRRAIYEQKIAPKGQKENFLPALAGVLKMRDEFFGFHIQLDTAYKLVSQTFQESEKCGLKEIEYVNFLLPLLTAQKNSTYKEIFKVGFRLIQESGVQNCEFRRFYTTKPICMNKGSNFVSVGLTDCYAAFLIFAIGVVCSLIMLLCEILAMRYKNNDISDLPQPKIWMETKLSSTNLNDLDDNTIHICYSD